MVAEYKKMLKMIEFNGLETKITPLDDPFWVKLTEMAQKQRQKGLKEYGKGIEDDTANKLVRLTRIEEELIDALYYIEHLKALYKEYETVTVDEYVEHITKPDTDLLRPYDIK